jgi:hypothetical protein
MQRTGHERSAAVHTTFITSSIDVPRRSPTAPRKATPPTLDTTADGILLSPAGTLQRNGTVSDGRAERGRQLAVAIRQRIESRLGGRVRDLAVRVNGNRIILDGRCATYYTKQLAQHAALGVLEDELLENNIAVAVPK